MVKNDKSSKNLIEPLPMVRVLLLHMIEQNPKISGYSLINKISEFSNSKVELRTGTVYNELRKLLPKKNTIVKTPNGEGRVVNTQILTQLVMVETADGVRTAVPVEEIEVKPTPQPKNKKPDDTPKDKKPNENKNNQH